MSYLGRKGAVAPLTSADIPAGIVEGTDIAFLENASGTQNLGGTYSTERMYLNDSYTLTGDVTITGHLALGTVADSDVVITQDSTERTITGSGTLDSGNVLQDTHRTSVTGMTGELGTGVTLGSAVTFPAGTIIYHNSDNRTSTGASADPGEGGMVDTGLTVTVPSAIITACSKIMITAFGSCINANDTYSICQYHLRRVESGTTTSLAYQNVGFLTTVTNNYHGNWAFSWVDTSLGSGDHTYKITVSAGGNDHSNAITYLGYNNAQANITVLGIV